MAKDDTVMSGGSSETPAPGSTQAEPVAEAPAKGEDQHLTCVECGAEFVFTAEEQARFKERNLHAPPKRCVGCRAARREGGRGRRGRGGGGRLKDYRSPAFRERRDADRIYRSPAFQKREDLGEIYRSPAFQKQEDVDEIYRSPAFQKQGDSEEIYRAPAFQKPVVFDEGEGAEGEGAEVAAAAPELVVEAEHDLESGPPPGYREPRSPEEIYRSPAFSNTDPANYAPSYKRRQPHEIVCAKCGKKATVPFKPQKDRPVLCQDCFGKSKK
jgi:CxxC-x17-CxxC domain-containing protein